MASGSEWLKPLVMPRPCAVETHARSYKISQEGFADATAVCLGCSRFPLKTSFCQIPVSLLINQSSARHRLGRLRNQEWLDFVTAHYVSIRNILISDIADT